MVPSMVALCAAALVRIALHDCLISSFDCRDFNSHEDGGLYFLRLSQFLVWMELRDILEERGGGLLGLTTGAQGQRITLPILVISVYWRVLSNTHPYYQRFTPNHLPLGIKSNQSCDYREGKHFPFCANCCSVQSCSWKSQYFLSC